MGKGARRIEPRGKGIQQSAYGQNNYGMSLTKRRRGQTRIVTNGGREGE
jgi:hypothetical protein